MVKMPIFVLSKEEYMNDLKDMLSEITTFIFDYDGVMTDGTVYMDSHGDPLRTSNVKDGYAIQLARKLGYNVAVISGAIYTNITTRMNSLGVEDVFTAVPNKVVKLEEYMHQKNLKSNQIVFVGDDIPDIMMMKMASLKCCPADAVEEVKEISDYVSYRNGGNGAVRDVIEQTIKAQGHWLEEDAGLW